LEELIGVHEAYLEGPSITAEDTGLWAEFQACLDLGLDPDVQFAKDRFSRMLITGGSVASRAITAMRRYDVEKMRELRLKGKH